MESFRIFDDGDDLASGKYKGISWTFDESRPVITIDPETGEECSHRFLDRHRGIGFKAGSKHGGLEILDGDPNLNVLVDFWEQQKYATQILPCVEMYWGPSFKVVQHGQWPNQDYVQLYRPIQFRDGKPFTYLRTPALLVPTKQEHGGDKPLIRLLVAAFRLILDEVDAYANQDFIHDLADDLKAKQKIFEKSLHLASRDRLTREWEFFVKDRLAMPNPTRGYVKDEGEIARLYGPKEYKGFFERVWNGSYASKVWVANNRWEQACDLDRRLPTVDAYRQHVENQRLGM